MKVLIFGGSGFLGSHVADKLSDNGYQVTIFDLNESPYLRSDQEMIIGDILDYEAVMHAAKGVDYIYNFAGIADLDDAGTRPLETIRLNLEGNTIILEAAVKENCKRFVYASTIYVYSNKGGYYRCSKQSAELYIEEFKRKYGLDYTIVRYGTLYGPRSDHRNSIYNYLRDALTNKAIKVNGSGDEMREYIHVRDAADLSIKILNSEYTNTHVTVTGHQAIRFKDLLSIIKEIMNNEIQLEYSGMYENNAHYSMTPYSYHPKTGYKLTSNKYIDLGQGLLECIYDVDSKLKHRQAE